MLFPDRTSTSQTATNSPPPPGWTSTSSTSGASTPPSGRTSSTGGASTPPPGMTSSTDGASTLPPGRTSTFLAAIVSTSSKNYWKKLVRSSSPENLWTKNNCSSKHMPYTPKQCAPLPSTPQSFCPETKMIYSTYRSVKSSFSPDSSPSISPNIRVFDSSSVRTSFSPVKRVLDLPVKSMLDPARIHDSPTKRIHLSPAEATNSKSQFTIPSTSSFKDSSNDYYSHREKISHTESEKSAFQYIPSLADNREAPVRYPADETRNVVQTSAHETIKNVIERFEFSYYANNRGNDTDNVFEKDANDLLRTLPKNIAYKCIDFVLGFLEQAHVLVQYQDISRTESRPRRRTTSNLTGKHGTPTRNLVNEAILVVETSAHQVSTRIFGRETISRFAVSREFDNDDESADFADETRNLLMRLPENIAYECKGFILYFLDQTVNATWTG